MSKQSLPDADEPFVLADGTEIDPKTGLPIPKEFVPVPTNTEAVEVVHRTRIRLSDIPVPPEQMNAVSVIVAYMAMGMSIEEIAIATKMTVKQVENVRQSDIYEELRGHLIKGITEADAENVRTLISQNTMDAARKVINLMKDDGAGKALQFNAAKDVLDRGGQRPVDVHEHRILKEDELRIVYIKRDENEKPPTIELEAMEVDEDGDR